MSKTNASLLLLAGLILLAGCQKVGAGIDGTAKGAVRFSASTASVATKTVYGAFDQAGTWQSIDWQNDDKIRIYSKEAVCAPGYEAGAPAEELVHWADYLVTGATVGTNQNNLSKATLRNVQSEGGLLWGDATSATFYGVYPAPAASEGAGAEIDGANGILTGSIPATQSFVNGKTDMSYATMTAAVTAPKPDVDDVENVIMQFYPAFTAFEFRLNGDKELTLKDFEISSTSTALAGAFAVTYTGTSPVYICSGTGKKITIANLGTDAKIGPNKTFTFTVLCLPQNLKDLTISFTVRASDWTKDETRKLVLNDKNGNAVIFAACKKHIITGTMQGSYNFKYITLVGEALDWDSVEVGDNDSDELPQSSQFAVSDGKNGRDITGVKADRQTWVFQDIYPVDEPDGKFDPMTVSYKVFTPAGGTWELIPQGDVDKFTIMLNTGVNDDELIWEEVGASGISGAIRSKEDESTFGTTKVLFTIVPKNRTVEGAEAARIWFKTYVYDGPNKTGTKYSLDSETQLYDTRGYHYFQTYNPTH